MIFGSGGYLKTAKGGPEAPERAKGTGEGRRVIFDGFWGVPDPLWAPLGGQLGRLSAVWTGFCGAVFRIPSGNGIFKDLEPERTGNGGRGEGSDLTKT